MHPLPSTYLRQTGHSAHFGWRFDCGMVLGDRGTRVAEWGAGYGDRLSNAFNRLAQVAHAGARRLFSSFDLFDAGIDRPVAGYQLAGSHLEQRSGRYRLAVLL
ncbi:MAG TPA: hypothetical protein V6C57_11560 [Coleofasciculaceae cyanobacterium]